MPIETRHLKRGVAYRAVVTTAGRGSTKISRTFKTKAAAQAWERDMLLARERGLLAANPSEGQATPSERLERAPKRE